MNQKHPVAALSIVCVFLLAGFLSGCTQSESKPLAIKNDSLASDAKRAEAVAKALKEKLARGKYWVDISGCHDCHSPKVFRPDGTYVDTTKILSGSPAGTKLLPVDKRSYKVGFWMLFSPDLTFYVGSWGINYAANITPDSTTGIGTWSEKNFLDAIRKGKHAGQEGGRDILPPMPWRKYAKLHDDDLKAIYAYLRTIPPIHNKVPERTPPTQ